MFLIGMMSGVIISYIVISLISDLDLPGKNLIIICKDYLLFQSSVIYINIDFDIVV